MRERRAARGVTMSTTLRQALLDEPGVATLHRSVFGRPGHELSLRLALVDFDGAVALDGLAAGETLDAAVLKRHCGRVVEGIEAMARWAEG